jgi:hypothetical protein
MITGVINNKMPMEHKYLRKKKKSQYIIIWSTAITIVQKINKKTNLRRMARGTIHINIISHTPCIYIYK